jgi:hypothetical protein
MAGTYIRNNEGKRAFTLYQEINWSRATAVDYAGAIAAASAAHQKEAGRQWLTDGLEAFPNDPQLLTAAAQFEEGMGDTHKAEVYWRKVVANSSQVKLSAQLTGLGAPSATATTASDALAKMLAPKNAADVQPASVAPMASQPESLQDAISSLPVIQHPASEATTNDSNEQASPWLVRKAPPSPQTQPIAYQPPQSSGSRWAVPVSDAPAPEPVELPQRERSPRLASAAGAGQAYLTNASSILTRRPVQETSLRPRVRLVRLQIRPRPAPMRCFLDRDRRRKPSWRDWPAATVPGWEAARHSAAAVAPRASIS